MICLLRLSLDERAAEALRIEDNVTIRKEEPGGLQSCGVAGAKRHRVRFAQPTRGKFGHMKHREAARLGSCNPLKDRSRLIRRAIIDCNKVEIGVILL